MINIKFINATSVQLVDQDGNTVSNVGEFTSPTEYSYSGNTFSKSQINYYHFEVEGTNVQLSGTIGDVTEAYQYWNLFKGQSAITDASNLTLSSTGTKRFCYSNMFMDCSNLTSSPIISATTLAEWCFQGMFAGCSSLTSAPALIATTMAPYCYFAMFYGCSSLTNSPLLPATQLANWCYGSMFFNCKSLTSISANFTSWNTAGNSTTHWVTGIDTIGDFYNQNVAELYGDDNVPQTWKPNYSNIALTFKSTGNTTVYTGNTHLSYKKNSDAWTTYNAYDVIQLSNGDKVSFSGTASAIKPEGQNALTGFATGGNGSLEVYGNPHSVIGWGDLSASCFAGMFASFCQNIKHASNLVLSATTLVKSCYNNMFMNCKSLEDMPQLPATNLADKCYYYMFDACSSLVTSPNLPATILNYGCYTSMFQGCKSITEATISATTFASPSPPTVPGDVIGCCASLFQNCSSLTSVTVNFTSWPDLTGVNMYQTLSNWLFSENFPIGEFHKPTELPEEYSTSNNLFSKIPQGWTVINK